MVGAVKSSLATAECPWTVNWRTDCLSGSWTCGQGGCVCHRLWSWRRPSSCTWRWPLLMQHHLLPAKDGMRSLLGVTTSLCGERNETQAIHCLQGKGSVAEDWGDEEGPGVPRQMCPGNKWKCLDEWSDYAGVCGQSNRRNVIRSSAPSLGHIRMLPYSRYKQNLRQTKGWTLPISQEVARVTFKHQMSAGTSPSSNTVLSSTTSGWWKRAWRMWRVVGTCVPLHVEQLSDGFSRNGRSSCLSWLPSLSLSVELQTR